MRIIAVDPGSTLSAYVVLRDGVEVQEHVKVPNEDVVARLRVFIGAVVVIEFMSPRGMPTSREEMEAMFWAGRFAEAAAARGIRVERVTRDAVKYHLCGRRSKVTDSNVRAALIDRFGGLGGKSAAIGTKAHPGPLHGVAADEWAALGVAVTFLDQEAGL